MEIAAGKFKAECLRLMELVKERHEEIIITKRGRPVAKLVPTDDGEEEVLFGRLAGTVTSHGDLTAPLGEAWHAE